MSIEDRVRELNGGTYTKKSYSVEEVQSILGITRQTVYKLIKQGWSYVKKKYKLNTTNFLFLCNC